MVMETDMTWGGEHSTIYRGCITELYTLNLYNFINQCKPNESIKKIKVYNITNF